MLRLRFRQYESAAESVVATGGYRGVVVGRRNRRRWCSELALTASILALLAISLGFPVVGVAVYAAAVLPFAFVA